jgi:hypothetical protein
LIFVKNDFLRDVKIMNVGAADTPLIFAGHRRGGERQKVA